jgi:hypothetical protein
MFRFKLTPILSVFVCLISIEVNGQAARTPFSAFGYGEYVGESLVNGQGMAGTGVSNPQVWYLNNQNPALLVNNRITVFQAGLVGENRRLYSDTLKEKSRNGNLNYLTLGFPVKRNKKTGEIQWATAIGLMPYSRVNHSLDFIDSINGQQVINFDRSVGGFNQFYWSNGVRLNKYINVGLKTSMMFSSIISDYGNLLNDPGQADKYLINVHEILSVRGIKFTPALSFRKDSIASKYTFSFGATYELKSNISSKLAQVMERKDLQGNVLQKPDTVIDNSGKIAFPQRLVAGISFGRLDKWMLASDFTFTKPSSSTLTVGPDQYAVQNGWRLSVGAELTPDVRSLSSYLKRVTYRTGVSTEHGTYLVNGNAVKDFGINFGLSFPVNRISSLDVAFRVGQRGDKKLNGIEENYFKVYFGVTFNDQWFIKRRFD